jgi:hypothetical protein
MPSSSSIVFCQCFFPRAYLDGQGIAICLVKMDYRSALSSYKKLPFPDSCLMFRLSFDGILSLDQAVTIAESWLEGLLILR